MSTDFSAPRLDERRTNVRYHILAAATAASFIMYLHRSFIAEILKRSDVRAELNLDDDKVALTYTAFFLSYALCQVPMGWVADAFGRRMAFTIYVITWSALTAVGGLATGFAMLFFIRLMLGVAQAGAYPTAGGIVGAWVPVSQRGSGSALIAAGGRLGGVFYGGLTAWLMFSREMAWQSIMLLYGAVGVLIGFWFWIVARNEPRDHPWCNAAEVEYINHGRPPERHESAPVRAPVGEMLASPVMWCMAVAQFGTNIGWAFVITTLPKYYQDSKLIDGQTGGWLVSAVWACGFFGALFGGRLVDYTTQRYGRRWGRILPTIVTRFLAAAFYVTALVTDDPIVVTAAFAIATFFNDLGLPGIWAFAQDVGGRNVGAVLGFGNMFGNLGAAAAAPIYLWANRTIGGSAMNHDGTIIAAMVGFVISGIAAFGINAAKPIGEKRSETSAA
jgi:ACS family glucarate transporter-like MFS transporter